MNQPAAKLMNVLRLLPRAVLVVLVLAAPVLAMPAMRADVGSAIEAPTAKQTAVGFVLLVSLQRG